MLHSFKEVNLGSNALGATVALLALMGLQACGGSAQSADTVVVGPQPIPAALKQEWVDSGSSAQLVKGAKAPR